MAALKPTCSIDGCNAPVKFRGYCRPHYRRWKKHGDPLGGRASSADLLAFLSHAKAFTGSECLIWPFGLNGRGYAQITIDGADYAVHRLLCEFEHGDAPSPGLDAAHSCGNGHHGCVNRSHLSWKTRAENFDDRRDHGTWPEGENHPRSILTESDVHAIRALEGRSTQAEIAVQFGIGRQQVSNILRRKSWAHI